MAAEFRELVMQHDLAAEQRDIGVHHALAILGHLLEGAVAPKAFS